MELSIKLSEVKRRIKKLEKASKKRRGPKSRLFEPVFQEAFLEAILLCGDNGYRIHEYLTEQKQVEVSYKATMEYLRWIFGTYPGTGRPPKYLTKARRQATA